MRFLQGRVAQLKPHLQRRVEMRVALHRHPGVAGVMEAAAEMLAAIPGVELIDLKQPAVGLQSVNVGVLPSFKRELQLNELQAACDAGVDALVAVYHSDHRELCAHERDWPFRIINILEVIGESIGLHRQDRYKQLKIMQAADQIVAECSDLIAKHSLDAGNARNIVAKAMLYLRAARARRGNARAKRRYDRAAAFGGLSAAPAANKLLRPTGKAGADHNVRYRASRHDCRACPLKPQCSPNTPSSKITCDVHEDARDHARSFVGRLEFEQSRDQSALASWIVQLGVPKRESANHDPRRLHVAFEAVMGFEVRKSHLDLLACCDAHSASETGRCR